MKDPKESTVGERLRQLRHRLGKTQKEFAKALGIHPMTLSKYELGKWNPSDKLLKLIEAKFDVNYNWLLNGKGTMFNFGIQAIKEKTTAINKLLELAETDVALKVLTDKLIETLLYEGVLSKQDKKLIKVVRSSVYRRLTAKIIDIYTEVLTQLAIAKPDSIKEEDLIYGGDIAKALTESSILAMLRTQKKLADKMKEKESPNKRELKDKSNR